MKATPTRDPQAGINGQLSPVDGCARLFIDGEWYVSRAGATLDVVNPSNGKPCASIPEGCGADVERAVTAARRAFEDGRWSDAPPSFRKKTLHRLADLIAAEADALDALDALEMGKPVRETLFNAASAAGHMSFCAEAVDKVMGDVLTSDAQSFVMQRRVPRGVVAAVTPWNFPTFNAVLKAAPALAAGNTVVLKPSELASGSTLRLAQLASEAGVPPGVLNVLIGRGEIVGQALGLHMDVDMMTFTGSTEVGKRMLQYSGQSNMKVVMAECGGKSPQILFDDGVDLDGAADAIARFLLTNQGQICSVGSRLLVERSIETAILERISVRFKEIVMGDATDPATTFGPLASADQCTRVMSYIQGAEAAGAERVIGGRRTRLDSGGYFVEPTLFRNVSSTARIAREEIFGPVLSVMSFADEAEAVRIANGTVYGLAAVVWAASLSRGMRLAKGIRSGVRINSAVPRGEGAGHATSWEPFRQSGVGAEGGMPGIESYLRRQRVWFAHD
jgi:acyl-CoA reductase-like NAD-dependent aldehyde dehydrogenase